MLTKGAIGNLLNRYKAVLKKCNLINTFGSLAVASMLVLGGAGVANAAINITGGIDKDNRTDIATKATDNEFKGATSGALIVNGFTTGKNLIFKNNTSTQDAGAIQNSGNIYLESITFDNNHALGTTSTTSKGGAIYNTGTATIIDSIF